MKTALIVFASLIGSSAFAAESCYEKLTQGYTQDSASYHVYADFNEGTSAKEQARSLVARAIDKAGCAEDALTIKKVSCKELVAGQNHTQVCYVSADIGYFFTTQDFVDTANVVFNRWD